MIVVPALAESDDGQPPVVAAVVRRGEAARTDDVRQRIDGKGAVIQQYSRNDVAPDECAGAADQEHEYAESDRRKKMIAVEPAEFGETGEVGDQLGVVIEMLGR